MVVPEAAVAHYREMLRIQALALVAGRRAWRRVEPTFIAESWTEAVRALEPVVVAAQTRAAAAGASYGALTLAQQGSWVAPEAFIDPDAFSGYAADGRSLSGLLMSPAYSSKTFIGNGASPTQALKMGRASLDTLLRTVVADAGRQAAGVDITSRPNTGYVRMLNPPSCVRCLALAGRFYKHNDGFQRHKGCDCIHVPSAAGSTKGARDEGLIDDPKAYWDSLSTAEQNKAAGFSNAQAIRDGADINRVVNSTRGRSGLTTTEGTGRKGFAANVRGQRLTPEGIYRQASSREEALGLLERHGYVIPGGQVPRVTSFPPVGERNGFLTAAERRLRDSEQRWLTVLDGRNPYTRDGSGLTPTISAKVETDYRRWLTSGGQIFTR